MKKYEVTIEGVSPLMQNRLGLDLIKETKQIEKSKLEQWENDNWKKKLYIATIDGKEEIIWPEANVRSLLTTSAMKCRVRCPLHLGKTWTNYFKSSVIVEQPAVIKGSDPTPYGAMVNGNPSSAKKSSKVWRVRPKIDQWKTTISFIDVGEELDEDIVNSVIKYGGMFIGFSDYRPLYGRFKILKTKTTEI